MPNHVAPDHPWVRSHPELFINGDEAGLRAQPAGWLRSHGRVLARGRDPHFAPWPDVVQLDAFSLTMRAATASVRITHPHVVFIAEAYWEMEGTLQQQGFDFCYDKRLYDRIVSADASAVREHLRAGLDYQWRLLRFLENHDEPRIAGALGTVAARAAAGAIATLPGAVLWHQGQFEGRRVRPSAFLSRLPAEAPDSALADWYRTLLAAVAGQRVRSGAWRLLATVGWPDNDSSRHLLAWSWNGEAGSGRHVVVVNFSGQPSQGRIPRARFTLAGRGGRRPRLGA